MSDARTLGKTVVFSMAHAYGSGNQCVLFPRTGAWIDVRTDVHHRAGKYHAFALKLPSRPSWRLLAHPEEYSGSSGDPEVQEELLRLVRAGVSKERNRERLVEDVREIVEAESDRLKKATNEAKKDLDQLLKLMRDRSTLETGSALADINKSADDFEEELRRKREEMESRQAEFEAWEEQVARERNRGQFFQGLYESAKDSRKKTKSKAAEKSLHSDAASRSSGEIASRTKPVEAAGKEEVGSNTRVYIFFFLAFNLTALCIADVMSSEPSYVADGLYMLLAAGLGATAWRERRLLFTENESEEPHSRL